MFGNNERWDSFVVIEGIDGAGTSTQRQLLGKAMGKSDEDFLDSWEPTPGPVGVLIRNALKSTVKVLPETLSYLYAADRYEHLFGSGGVKSYVDRGKWALSDRYFHSSLAYQSLSMPMEAVWNLNRTFPLPGYLIFIDVDIETSAERRAKRGGESDIFEEDSILAKVRQNYRFVLEKLKEERADLKFLELNGQGSIESLHREICTFLGIAPIV